MTFSGDEDDVEWTDEPQWSASPPIEFDHRLRVEFLRLLQDGLGRSLAASQLGVSWSTLKAAMADSPSFREAVRQVERGRMDNLFTGLYVAALQGDTRAAMFLLSREQRETPGS